MKEQHQWIQKPFVTQRRANEHVPARREGEESDMDARTARLKLGLYLDAVSCHLNKHISLPDGTVLFAWRAAGQWLP